MSPVERRTISEYITADTTVEAERLIDVLADASGEILEVFVEEGDRVAAGAVLARLDQRELKLELREAEIDLESSERSFHQTEELRNTNIVSEEEYEQQKYRLQMSEIMVEKARLRLANTEIVSPLSGIVTHRYIELGDTVGSNQKTFSVGDFDPLLATIHIPEKDLALVRVGQDVAVSAESAPGRQLAGVVRRVSPIVEAESGTVKIRIQILPPTEPLKPGMFIPVYLADRPDLQTARAVEPWRWSWHNGHIRRQHVAWLSLPIG